MKRDNGELLSEGSQHLDQRLHRRAVDTAFNPCNSWLFDATDLLQRTLAESLTFPRIHQSHDEFCFQIAFWLLPAKSSAYSPTFFILFGNDFRKSYCMISLNNPLHSVFPAVYICRFQGQPSSFQRSLNQSRRKITRLCSGSDVPLKAEARERDHPYQASQDKRV